MFEAETEIPKQCYILVSDDICREVAGMIHMPCTFPLLPASVCMMVGWGVGTHNRPAALSYIYQISRNISIHSSTPNHPSEGYIIQMSVIGSLSRTNEQ